VSQNYRFFLYLPFAWHQTGNTFTCGGGETQITGCFFLNWGEKSMNGTRLNGNGKKKLPRVTFRREQTANFSGEVIRRGENFKGFPWLNNHQIFGKCCISHGNFHS
jgi:hypothetical protein